MATREYVLQRLEAERLQAVQCFERGRAAELSAQITRLSAGTPANPAAEATGRPARKKSTA